MISFREIKLSDRPWINRLLNLSDYPGSEYCFGNNFIWRHYSGITVSRYKSFYLARTHLNGGQYLFPAGEGDIADVLDKLIKFTDGKLTLAGVTNENKKLIEENFPRQFKFFLGRDQADYIYLKQDLELLSGKKYHSKRTHLNKFKTLNPDFCYEPIDKTNISHCIKMYNDWLDQKKQPCLSGQEIKSLDSERQAIICSFENFSKLGFKGGLITTSGKVLGFTFGERLNSNSFVIHVEKAYHDVPGAYAAINNEFVKHLGDDIKYVNREEDLGLSNLRKAKLSYRPVNLLEKFIAKAIV